MKALSFDLSMLVSSCKNQNTYNLPPLNTILHGTVTTYPWYSFTFRPLERCVLDIYNNTDIKKPNTNLIFQTFFLNKENGE
jgi:hypothetical protein